mgnify:CR=1 FL=1
MPDNDDFDWVKQTLRATFPYLVFILTFILGSVIVVLWANAEEPEPQDGALRVFPRAHSHNDYFRDRPLVDALELGFCSVEADIYLVKGALLVAHDRDKVVAEKTLEALYLEPMWARFQDQGHVQPQPVTLLIDIKNEGATTYTALHQVLQNYAPMLTHFGPNSNKTGAVTVIISGDRAVDTILASAPRLAGIDGRLSDLGGSYTSDQMPLISDNWMKHFTWRGKGEFSEAEAKKLQEVVSQAHEKGMRVRFWATPQREEIWQVLFDAGVDLLNADNLPRLQELLLKQPVE